MSTRGRAYGESMRKRVSARRQMQLVPMPAEGLKYIRYAL